MRMRVDVANQIRGVLKRCGLIASKGGSPPFAERVPTLAAGGPSQEVVEAMLALGGALARRSQFLAGGS